MMALNGKILAFFMLVIGTVVLARTASVRLPGNNQGYEPVQPIAYSHRLHAGELGIDCQYCHYGAERSRHAGIPSASVCMNCHKTVTSGFDAFLEEREAAEKEEREPQRIVSSELRKLFDAVGLDEKLEPTGELGKPIEWVRVHNLPDFVYFDHRVHVAKGLACETCHGPVQSMERIRQHSDLSMGWCVNCHRESSIAPEGHLVEHASTDCGVCHY
ncbi:MAG: cytochrome c3 family protein [Planctomycetota bacterium]|jgi:hypothetical protein|nr:cytochrome c3 family protein [Planctomycetota bacterium]